MSFREHLRTALHALIFGAFVFLAILTFNTWLYGYVPCEEAAKNPIIRFCETEPTP